MMPPNFHPNWSKLVKGELAHSFKVASANMLFFNLKMKYQHDPAALPAHIEEAQRFFKKYEEILVPDIAAIFGRKD